MPKFFADPQQFGNKTVTLTEDAHHIAHVLRMKAGDVLTVCDGMGIDYHVEIERVSDTGIVCHILSGGPSKAEPSVKITLFQGLPKGDKMETILQKGTELGISAYVPVSMERSIVRYDAKKDAKKNERFRKIAESAAKQSGRGRIPAVSETISLKEAAERVKDFDLFLVPYENGQEHPLKTCLQGLEKAPQTAAILIGPEGGIEPSEIDLLEKAGARIVGLGPRILRTETAGPAAAAMLLYHFDQM